MTDLRVTILGSGTSAGVPMIGCSCAVCRSDDPRNERMRPGIRIEYGGRTVLVDTPTDLRRQALTFAVDRVDAVLFTHPHADHIFGLDDLRAFSRRQGAPIPSFGSASTLESLRQTFRYVFESGGQAGGGRPKIELHQVDEPFDLLGRIVMPIPVWHGEMPVTGYRIGDFAYVTDVNAIPADSIERLRGVETLILGALRPRSHPTHFSIDEAIAASRQIGPRRTVFTHLNHEVDHGPIEKALPTGFELAYDGLRIETA